jgi:uncharacterized protein
VSPSDEASGTTSAEAAAAGATMAPVAERIEVIDDGTYILALGYAAGLALLARQERWRRRLAPAAAVGRMALTNYVAQSLLCVTLFTTIDLYGTVGPALLLLPTVAVYAGQVWFSNWWMGRFRFGPLESLWRSFTYGGIGSLRGAAPAPAIADG